MSDAKVRIPYNLHNEMKALAGTNRGAIYQEYIEAISNHIKVKKQQKFLDDTELESFINDRIGKAENHLASMLGRTGMDVSMTLMGVILFLEKFFAGKVTREEIQEKLRIDGARYFTSAVQRDKNKL